MAKKAKTRINITGKEIAGFIALLLIASLVVVWAIGSNGFTQNDPRLFFNSWGAAAEAPGDGNTGTGTSDKPNTSDTPGTPDKPNTPDTPGTSDKPNTPDTPGTSDKPNTPDTPSVDYTVTKLLEDAGEVYIYVQQPAGDTAKVTQVKGMFWNMAETRIVGGNGHTVSLRTYDLEFISSSGTEFKYKVTGWEIFASPGQARKYDITEMYVSDGMQTVTYEVSQEFIATTLDDGTIQYTCKKI